MTSASRMSHINISGDYISFLLPTLCDFKVHNGTTTKIRGRPDVRLIIALTVIYLLVQIDLVCKDQILTSICKVYWPNH